MAYKAGTGLTRPLRALSGPLLVVRIPPCIIVTPWLYQTKPRKHAVLETMKHESTRSLRPSEVCNSQNSWHVVLEADENVQSAGSKPSQIHRLFAGTGRDQGHLQEGHRVYRGESTYSREFLLGFCSPALAAQRDSNGLHLRKLNVSVALAGLTSSNRRSTHQRGRRSEARTIERYQKYAYNKRENRRIWRLI